MDIKGQLTAILEKSGTRGYVRGLKANPELLAILQEKFGDLPLKELFYLGLNDVNPYCKNGNRRSFESITTGYRQFCGPSRTCECARASVSAKVSKSKQLLSDDEKAAINEKRAKTNIERYGASNSFQTPSARNARAQVYRDSTPELVAKVKATKKERYGDENFNNPKKISATWQKKQEYWYERYPEKELQILKNKDELEALYESIGSVTAIAEQLSVHVQTVYRYLAQHGIREPFKSSGEVEVAAFLRSAGVSNFVTNTRKVLPSGRELDIYLPDHNLAIEYNGIYWHSEDNPHITKTYHRDKFIECEQQGIQLLSIFSNFWDAKREIIEDMILSKLKINPGNRVFARKCQIKEVTSAQAREFLERTHIQGYATSQYRFGLFHDDEMVAVMTFSNSRVGISKANDGIELVRFASVGSVVGGASKLLAHFIKTHSPDRIVSFSDNEWSNGSLYRTLGFELETDIPCGYWYFDQRLNRAFHRYTFAKHKLVEQGYDPKKTEREITRDIGLLRIWDAGKRKWVMNLWQK